MSTTALLLTEKSIKAAVGDFCFQAQILGWHQSKEQPLATLLAAKVCWTEWFNLLRWGWVWGPVTETLFTRVQLMCIKSSERGSQMHQVFHCFDSGCFSASVYEYFKESNYFWHDCLILIQHMQQLRTIFAGLRQVFWYILYSQLRHWVWGFFLLWHLRYSCVFLSSDFWMGVKPFISSVDE